MQIPVKEEKIVQRTSHSSLHLSVGETLKKENYTVEEEEKCAESQQ